MISESSSHAKEVIEEWRADLGISQDELARTAGLSLSTLQRIMRGNKPLLKHARSLEEVLGWRRGSLDAVIAGGQPTPDVQPEPEEPEPTNEDMRKTVDSLAQQVEELQAMLRRRSEGA